MTHGLSPEDRGRLEELFDLAADLPAEAHAAFLERECGSHAALRAELAQLLAGLAGEDHLGRAGDASLLRPGSLVGPYRIVEQIGEGGMGEVYLAEQSEPLARRVALKLIKVGMDTREVVARFEAERQALAVMDHPGIAKVFDAGSTEAGRPYFVMEYIRGTPVLEHCETNELDTVERLELFVRICYAIQHAHQKGIIHRDIKPNNVLVAVHDGTPTPTVIDFGIARAVDREQTARTVLTRERQMVGTPTYMSPEQAGMAGLDIDTRTDVYSLGVLLYELLTGTPPFDAGELQERGLLEMLRVISEETPPRPSTRVSTLRETAATATATPRGVDTRKLAVALRGDLDWIVMKCLEKDRARRYVTADGLAADIERHLRDEPVLAGPPGATYRLRKFVRRNRAGVLTASAMVAVLVLGVVGTTRGMLWALAEKDRADVEAQAKLEAQAEVARRAAELQEARLERSVSGRLSRMAEHYSHVASEESVSYEKQADALWPPHPDQIEDLESWISRARALVGHLPQYRARLEELRSIERTTSAAVWEFNVLEGLVEGMERLDSGLLAEDSVQPGYGWSVPKRLNFARRLRDGMVEGGDWDWRWTEAIEDIRRHPAYRGLQLSRQWGLVPIGRDPTSGLWEFWHVASGEEPDRIDGDIRVTDETGIVLVLIPGGRFLMGAQATDPDGVHFDKDSAGEAPPAEFPVHEVDVDAFFMSKYEMTQGQWLRSEGANPSMDGQVPGDSPKRPVNMVSPLECERVAARFGLTTPHEKQWEYAARAGTDTVWWTGDDPASLEGKETLWDGVPAPQDVLLALKTREVDQDAPNPWGLYGVLGNLCEWCSNSPYGYGPGGIVADARLGLRTGRGGCFRVPASRARSAMRLNNPETLRMPFTGLRPSREIDEGFRK